MVVEKGVNVLSFNGKYHSRPSPPLNPCFVKILFSSFIGIKHNEDGGVMFIQSYYDETILEIKSSSFYKCSTDATSGAIYFCGQESLIEKSCFTHCFASSHYHSIRITLEPPKKYLNHFNESSVSYCSENNIGSINIALIFGQVHSTSLNGSKNMVKSQSSNIFMMSSRGTDAIWQLSNCIETKGHYSNYFNGQKQLFIKFCNFIKVLDNDGRYGLIKHG